MDDFAVQFGLNTHRAESIVSNGIARATADIWDHFIAGNIEKIPSHISIIFRMNSGDLIDLSPITIPTADKHSKIILKTKKHYA